MKVPELGSGEAAEGFALRSRWPVLLYGALTYLLGIRSLVYFVAFASNVPWVKTVDSGPGLPWPGALAVDLLLLLAFALSHSLMARSFVKRALARRLPAAAERSTYVLVAALMLSLLMWQWRPLGAVIWDVESDWGRHVLLSLAAAGWGLAAVAYYSIGHLELLGLRQAWDHFRHRSHLPGGLVTTGVYGALRHPMFLGFTIGLWATARMTAGHLLLALGMSLYLWIGMRYEKCDLVSRYGHRYLEYLAAAPLRQLLGGAQPPSASQT